MRSRQRAWDLDGFRGLPRPRGRCVCATFSDAFPPWQTDERGATVGLRPFLGKRTRCAIHNRRPRRGSGAP